MTKVVVIGAGIGGVPMAFELRELLGKTADIQVVSELRMVSVCSLEPLGRGQLANR